MATPLARPTLSEGVFPLRCLVIAFGAKRSEHANQRAGRVHLLAVWILDCNPQGELLAIASPHMKGRQPHWPGTLWRYYGKPALERAMVTKQVSYHTSGTRMERS